MTYNSLINACAKAGDPDRAEAWLRDMEVAGLSPGLVTINSVMNASAKADGHIFHYRYHK